MAFFIVIFFLLQEAFLTLSKLVPAPCNKEMHLDFNFHFEIGPREENGSVSC